MTKQPWIVHKFGGTSLADAGCFQRVAAILQGRGGAPQAAVVSAVGGVTDRLLALVKLARQRDDSYTAGLASLRADHERLADELLGRSAERDAFQAGFDRTCQNIADVLHATLLIGSETPVVRDVVAGAGELWSAQLLAGLLQKNGDPGSVDWLDARDVLVVEHSDLGPGVLWEESRSRIRTRVPGDFSGLLVITGFIARDSDGVQTTLGRNGSDYSASIFGALLDASQVNIWTDVPGVMSADPRLVAESAVIPELTYDEAMELAYFGAKVLHPQTMAPAVESGIPIYIRDTGSPNTAGTRIGSRVVPGSTVKGITAIDGMALVNVEGAGMIGVPGTAWRLFGALREAGVSVVLISQGSSEHSICFAVRDEHAQHVSDVLAGAFRTELESGQIHSVEITHGCSILAVVGDGMAGIPGVAAKVFGSLGRAGVNVRAIAQGSSERNISAVISDSDTVRALRAVHAGFYLSSQTLSIGLIGPGSVGSVLLEQIAGESGRLSQALNLDLRVRGIATSRHMVLDDRHIELDQWRDRLGASGKPVDLDRFTSHVHAEHLPHAVIIDCSASQAVADRYAGWLARGIHIVTPNKKANSDRYATYQRLNAERRAGDARYLYETTVGAALPIIQTLRDLRETGDRVRRIQGIFSGTLAYLFNLYDGQRPFSELVREACDQGYTEPDPRDDLSGMDVARKVVILGREMGLDLELDNIALESLVPEPLARCSIDEFLDGLSAYDDRMAAMYQEAAAAGEVLRYIGRLEADGRATVGLERLPASHSFANINLTDNIVQFETDRYCDNPLIVQGPGAGPAVTAGGVFSDLLRLAGYLGASV